MSLRVAQRWTSPVVEEVTYTREVSNGEDLRQEGDQEDQEQGILWISSKMEGYSNRICHLGDCRINS